MPQLFDYLLQHRARLNTRNRNGETALSIAAIAGASNSSGGWSKPARRSISSVGPPLSYAAYNGHTKIVEYLIGRGAEIDGKTENGSTALFFAARFGHLDTVKVLLKHGADPDHQRNR